MARDTGSGGGGNKPQEQKLQDWVSKWEAARERLSALRSTLDSTTNPDIAASTRERIEEVREEVLEWGTAIRDLVKNTPRLYDEALDLGFANFGDWKPKGGDGGSPSGDGREGTPAGQEDGTTPSSGSRGGGNGDDKPTPADLRDNARNSRMLGEKGKDWDVVRGPKGSYVIRFKFKIAGETVSIGLRVGKASLGKYGIKEGEGKQLTKEQMKRVKNIGWADELAPHIKKGDKHIIKALTRSLATQYEGQAILQNDEVMSVIIANSLKGWTAGEFENQLRQTKWYQNTVPYQRDWVLTKSEQERQVDIDNTKRKVTSALEDMYGDEWMKHVDGGMETVNRWAKQIASGKWGEPSEGFAFWADKQSDAAAKVEGTPSWWAEEKEREELNALKNRPEELFEQLRGDSSKWLGPNMRPDKATLMGWAEDLIAGKKSDHDWAAWLRQQGKALHPWKDVDTAWQDVASSYRSIAEQELGTTVDWTDQLLGQIGGDGAPISAHDFKLLVRQDARAWQEGTRLHDDAISTVAQLQDIFGGGF